MAHRGTHDSRLSRRLGQQWLRLAHVFIPAAQRADADTYRRARTTVYSCLVPVPMSLVFGWSYWRTLPGETALLATAIVLGTNAAALAALLTLRSTGNVVRAANLLLAYAFMEFAALA